jgi:hypothetical protein
VPSAAARLPRNAGDRPVHGYDPVMSFDGLLLLVLFWGTLALSVWAFADALLRPATAYVAAGKLTKPAWVGITAVAAIVLYLMRGPLSFLGLPAVIAAVVYLVDVRPAVRGMRRGNSW